MDSKISKKNTRVITDEITGEKRTLTVSNGGVSEEQINTWKKKYRRVHAIEIEDGEELLVGYFHRPDMETMSMVNKLAKSDEVKSSAAMFDNCWLGGDSIIQEDAIVKMSAIGELASLFGSCSSKIKNL